MKIINILPNNMIKPDMIRQDYELYLAHQILANPKRFEFLANDIKGKHYKILDNSAYELNKGLSLDLLLKAADIINADEIVLPDIYKSNDSFEYSLKYLTEIPVGFKRKIAMVAQGASIIDLTYSIDKIKRLKRVDTIMLPKWSWAWRMDLMHLLLNTDKTIHWLGMGDRITETVGPYTEMIRSIDTGYFTALASTNYEQSIFNKRIDDIEINLDDMPVREDNLINLMSQQKLFLEEINV